MEKKNRKKVKKSTDVSKSAIELPRVLRTRKPIVYKELSHTSTSSPRGIYDFTSDSLKFLESSSDEDDNSMKDVVKELRKMNFNCKTKLRKNKTVKTSQNKIKITVSKLQSTHKLTKKYDNKNNVITKNQRLKVATKGKKVIENNSIKKNVRDNEKPVEKTEVDVIVISDETFHDHNFDQNLRFSTLKNNLLEPSQCFQNESTFAKSQLLDNDKSLKSASIKTVSPIKTVVQENSLKVLSAVRNYTQSTPLASNILRAPLSPNLSIITNEIKKENLSFGFSSTDSEEEREYFKQKKEIKRKAAKVANKKKNNKSEKSITINTDMISYSDVKMLFQDLSEDPHIRNKENINKKYTKKSQNSKKEFDKYRNFSEDDTDNKKQKKKYKRAKKLTHNKNVAIDQLAANYNKHFAEIEKEKLYIE